MKKELKRIIHCILYILISYSSIAVNIERGSVNGVITDKKTKEPLMGAISTENIVLIILNQGYIQLQCVIYHTKPLL